MDNVVKCAADLIAWTKEQGWKCYITKGTGEHRIDRYKKTIILDLTSKDFIEKAELVKQKVDAIITKQRLKAAKNAQ